MATQQLKTIRSVVVRKKSGVSYADVRHLFAAIPDAEFDSQFLREVREGKIRVVGSRLFATTNARNARA